MNQRITAAKITVILSCLFILGGEVSALADNSRERQRLDENWKFYLGDSAAAASAGFDDAGWRSVILPHDWSIEGKFDPKNPMGGQGGFLPAGIGWYRLHLQAPMAWKDKKISVEFEGVYMNAEIYLNGKKLAFHPYGYTGFNVDLTPELKPGADNVLAVRVDNSQQKNCRWYSGSGIYRHVWLTVTGPVHIAPWENFIFTPKADEHSASVAVQTKVMNEAPTPQTVTVVTTLVAPDGRETSGNAITNTISAGGSQEFDQAIELNQPALWSPETPQLYQAVTRVKLGAQSVDEVSATIGVRHLAWSVAQGLTLNGKTYKLAGGCIHDDNGVLGACAFDRAEERKIELLKAAGFTALRTAHNPPSPELLDACDRLGMLVLDEVFDCWASGKNTYDYHLFFKDWWQRDIESFVQRDRNHPAVVMWSIGNEIPGVFSAMGNEYAPKLVAKIHSLDLTRPVTNGGTWPAQIKQPPFPGSTSPVRTDPNAATADPANPDPACWTALDIEGTNYRLGGHVARHSLFPDRVLVSTESMPPLGEPYRVADFPFAVGDFVWAAQDYLGEVGVGRWFYEGDPTEPMTTHKNLPPTRLIPIAHGSDVLYPWRGANPGSLDLLGNRKPASYRWNIVWNRGEKLYFAVRQPADDKKIIVAPWGWYPVWENWTWPGREGKPMGVDVYSRYPSVRLYLNDKLVGEMPTTRKEGYQATFKLTYQPGVLKAVGVEDGKESETMQLETVGDSASIKLSADRSTIHADGQDLSFIQVEVLDKQGRLQPNADELISFTLTGPGTIAGLGNAWLKSTEPFQGTTCHVYHGRALIVLRGSKQAGTLDLTAQAPGLQEARTLIAVKP